MPRHGAVPPTPVALVALLQIGRRELVLRGEAAIKAHLGDIGFGDDLVDADRADALAVEEAARDRQQPLARRRFRHCRCGRPLSSHIWLCLPVWHHARRMLPTVPYSVT